MWITLGNIASEGLKQKALLLIIHKVTTMNWAAPLPLNLDQWKQRLRDVDYKENIPAKMPETKDGHFDFDNLINWGEQNV